MRYKETELLRTFAGEENELFILIGERRQKFGTCDATFNIYRESTTIPILGRGTAIKEYKFVIVLGDNMELVKGQGLETLEKAHGMELRTKLTHENGITERILMGIAPFEIEVDHEWQCEIVDDEAKKKLINFR